MLNEVIENKKREVDMNESVLKKSKERVIQLETEVRTLSDVNMTHEDRWRKDNLNMKEWKSNASNEIDSLNRRLNETEIELNNLRERHSEVVRENNHNRRKIEDKDKLIKKADEYKKHTSTFITEVVGINEALVKKVSLLQDKERAKLKERDNKMRQTLIKGTHSSSARKLNYNSKDYKENDDNYSLSYLNKEYSNKN